MPSLRFWIPCKRSSGNLLRKRRRFDLLNQRSFIYAKISVERSEAEAAEALRLANAIGYSKGIADGYSATELDQVVKEINKKLGTLS